MRRRTLLKALGIPAVAATGGAWWWTRRWRYIVVHHSGGARGDFELLRRVHRQRQPNDPIDMIPYHFVIGNGQGMAMGEVMPTRRWSTALWGAHVRGTDRNLRGIGICLIGNFETGKVPGKQYRSLISLVRDLRKSCGISTDDVTLHGQTPGENTKCPGRNFPTRRFFLDIA